MAENAGSGVGKTAVFGVEFSGIVGGVAEGDSVSNDHSLPAGGIAEVLPSNDPVPNDIEVAWSGSMATMASAACHPP